MNCLGVGSDRFEMPRRTAGRSLDGDVPYSAVLRPDRGDAHAREPKHEQNGLVTVSLSVRVDKNHAAPAGDGRRGNAL